MVVLVRSSGLATADDERIRRVAHPVSRVTPTIATATERNTDAIFPVAANDVPRGNDEFDTDEVSAM